MKLLNVCLLAFVVAVLTPTASISADEDMTAADTKALQGDWVSIREESGGKALTKTQLKEMNKRLTVKGNKFIIKRVIMDKLGTYDGRFEFDATQKPKAYDWTGKGPNGMPLGLQLIGAAEEENYLLATAAWCERCSPFKGLV